MEFMAKAPRSKILEIMPEFSRITMVDDEGEWMIDVDEFVMFLLDTKDSVRAHNTWQRLTKVKQMSLRMFIREIMFGNNQFHRTMISATGAFELMAYIKKAKAKVPLVAQVLAIIINA